jgi:DNA-binding response OmpR family regulator
VVSTTAPTETHGVLVVDDEPNISYLRKKLDEHRAPLTHSARGVGYERRAPRA